MVKFLSNKEMQREVWRNATADRLAISFLWSELEDGRDASTPRADRFAVPLAPLSMTISAG